MALLEVGHDPFDSSLPGMFSRPVMVMFLILFSCLALPATGSGAQPEAETGLEGEIRISPIRGGPDRIGVPNSKPLAHTVFVVKKEDQIIASFETDDQGRFRVSLPPGKYTVLKEGTKGRIGRYGPFEVEIVAGQIKKVQWEADSGLR